MRIMRKKLKDEVRRALALLSDQWFLDDRGFAEDLFILVRNSGGGIPTDERITAIATATAAKTNGMPIIMRALMARRAALFKELAVLAYFKSVCAELGGTPLDAVSHLLAQTRKFGRKERQSQCLSCQFLDQCKLGTAYSESAQDITRLAIKDAKSMAHAQCPHLPDLSAHSDMVNMVNFLNTMGNDPTAVAQMLKDALGAQTGDSDFGDKYDAAEEAVEENAPSNFDWQDDEVDPDVEEDFDVFFNQSRSGGSGGGAGGFTGNNLRLTERLLDKVSAEQLQLFDIGRVLDSLLDQPGTDKFTPTDELAKSNSTSPIESISEIGKADAAEFVAPNDMLVRKAVKGELLKTEYSKPQSKKHLLYVLIDNSGSMDSQVGCSNMLGAATRINFAAIFAAALARKIGREGGMMFFRLFGTRCGSLVSARTPSQFDSMQKMLARCDANGGGTSISTALRTAWADIQSARDEVAKAEVLVITDCEDTLNLQKLLGDKQRMKLHTLDVSGHSSGDACGTLQALSERYFKLDPTATSLQDMVKALVTPAKQPPAAATSTGI